MQKSTVVREKTRLFWLQPGNQVIGDQTFDAFAYVEDENSRLNDYVASRQATPHEARRDSLFTWIAVIVTISGFVCQFIGLRGLGPWIAIGQLAITLIMSFVRAGLHMRKLKAENNQVADRPDMILGHELDWLAFQFPRHPPASEEVSEKLGTTQVADRGAASCRKTDTPSNGGEQSVPSKFATQSTSSHVTTEKSGSRLATATETWYVGGFDPYQYPELPATHPARRILDYRARLSVLTGHHEPTADDNATQAVSQTFDVWEDDLVKVRQMAKRLASCLRNVANIVCGEEWSLDSCRIPVSTGSQSVDRGYITFPITKGPSGAIISSAMLEAVLGLWLWSLRQDMGTRDEYNKVTSRADEPRILRIVGTETEDSLFDLYRGASAQAELNMWLGNSMVPLSRGIIRCKDAGSDSLHITTKESGDTAAGCSLFVPILSSTFESEVKTPSARQHRFFGHQCLYGDFRSQPVVVIENHIESQDSAPQIADSRDMCVLYVESAAPSTLLEHCARDLYSTFLRQMVREVKMGETSMSQRRPDLEIRVEHDIVGQLVNSFTHPDHALGSERDAFLCIIPAIRQRLRESGYGTDLVRAVIAQASSCCDPKDYAQALQSDPQKVLQAELYLRFAVEIQLDIALFASPASTLVQPNEFLWALIFLAEHFRRCVKGLTEIRRRCYQGIIWMQKILRDHIGPKIMQEQGWDALLRRYMAIVVQEAQRHDEQGQLGAIDLSDVLHGEEYLQLTSTSAKYEFEDFVQINEDDCTELSNDTVEFLFSLHQKARTRCLAYCDSIFISLHPERISANPLVRAALPLAAENGWPEIVHQLLRVRVPVDSQDSQGRTALIHYAAAGNADQVTHLLSRGAKLYHQDADKCAPFYHACAHGHYNLVKRLLDMSDVDPNGNSDAEMTPLGIAAFNGFLQVVELLLTSPRIKIDLAGRLQATPLAASVIGGHPSIVELLLMRRNINVREVKQGDLLLLAAALGHDDVVRILLNDPVDRFSEWELSSPLNAEVLSQFGLGFKPWTALKTSTFALDRSALSYAAEYGHENVVRRLMRARRVEDYIFDVHNRSALWYAAANGHIAIVKTMLAHGDASDMLPTKDKLSFDTPLFAALRNDQVEVVKYLLEGEHQVAIREQLTERPIYGNVHVSHPDLALFLHTARMGSLAVFKGCEDVFLASSHPDTSNHNLALYCAAARGHADLVRFLLEQKKCDPNYSTEQLPSYLPHNASKTLPGTMLFLAVQHRHAQVLEILSKDERTRMHDEFQGAFGRERKLSPPWWFIVAQPAPESVSEPREQHLSMAERKILSIFMVRSKGCPRLNNTDGALFSFGQALADLDLSSTAGSCVDDAVTSIIASERFDLEDFVDDEHFDILRTIVTKGCKNAVPRDERTLEQSTQRLLTEIQWKTPTDPGDTKWVSMFKRVFVLVKDPKVLAQLTGTASYSLSYHLVVEILLTEYAPLSHPILVTLANYCRRLQARRGKDWLNTTDAAIYHNLLRRLDIAEYPHSRPPIFVAGVSKLGDVIKAFDPTIQRIVEQRLALQRGKSAMDVEDTAGKGKGEGADDGEGHTTVKADDDETV